MELRHLRYFVAAAEELHFGRAAEILSVTRPAVSQTIADLEAELGVALFERRAHKVRLTAAGESLFKHSSRVLSDLSQAVETAKRIGHGKLGQLVVGYGSLSLLHPLFRRAVKQFGSEYPDTEIALREMPSSAQIDAVRAGSLDAGFVYVALDRGEPKTSVPQAGAIKDLDSLELQEGGLGVALPLDHPLAKRKSLVLSDLVDEGFIVVRRSLMNPYFSFVPKIVQEVSNIATQVNLISVGMGVGLVVSSADLQYPQNIRVLPLRGIEYISQFRLIWRADQVNPILDNFVDTMRRLVK
ncbi:MAG: LysR substrate-binding domain-containing protein [Burkholderiaceae bacterium]